MEPTNEIDYRLIGLLTAEQAHAFRVVPIEVKGDQIFLWGDQTSLSRQPHLSVLLGKSARVTLLEVDTLNRYLSSYYPFEGKEKDLSLSYVSASAKYEESDVIRFVNKLFEEAVGMGASDIHIERYENESRIRFRWQGQLIEKYEVPAEQYNAIVSRIKILAELDISERRLPQDGRINLDIQGRKIDVRASSVPGKYGEKLVLRLLMRSRELLSLMTLLGEGSKEAELYEQAIRRPNGIILITGPTGSGKTTTLYASLTLLNRPDRNILTVEDPIEYNLSGINQIQVKEEIGLTFDRTLRAFLRQDPDIIMVGEIRDPETARIAIRAALTGHLVFSTLHTNSCWDAITRLVDMGVEPYLLAASLRLVAAQRLVRVLCPSCKKESTDLLYPEFQEQQQLSTHFLPQGCQACYYTGYIGRKAVFEMMPVTRSLADQIKLHQGDLSSYYKENDLHSLLDNLTVLVREGTTSLQEALLHWEG